MKKIFIIILLSLHLFAIENINNNRNMAQLFSGVKDVKSYIHLIEKNGVNNKQEYTMLGITYEFGIPKEGIKKNKEKALFYYKKAYDTKQTYGGIRYAVFLIYNKKYKKAEKVLDDLYFSFDKNDKENAIIINLEKKMAFFNGNQKKLNFFEYENASKNKNDLDALSIFYKKYYGNSMMEKDKKGAEKFLNIACKNAKHKKVIDFCMNSDLITRKENK